MTKTSCYYITYLKRDILVIIIGKFSEQINELGMNKQPMSQQNVSMGEIVLNFLNIDSGLASPHY